jgi:hypothetical protein
VGENEPCLFSTQPHVTMKLRAAGPEDVAALAWDNLLEVAALGVSAATLSPSNYMVLSLDVLDVLAVRDGQTRLQAEYQKRAEDLRELKKEGKCVAEELRLLEDKLRYALTQNKKTPCQARTRTLTALVKPNTPYEVLIPWHDVENPLTHPVRFCFFTGGVSLDVGLEYPPDPLPVHTVSESLGSIVLV